jgi:SagB-type dehydrogenase family enzyme
VTGRGVTGAVHTYHDGTKHHFHRFARSLGYLDWASQPNPFRSFPGAEEVPLFPRPDANPQSAIHNPQSVAVADVLRHSLGLSAWKQFGASRWALRVNPSSGNLHPTEAYVIAGAAHVPGGTASVHHYAPDRHALERRCAFDAAAWSAATDPGSWLIGLTSVHWREAWKYGERAFRYCQHDLGHAIAAIRIAAAMAGSSATLMPEWSHDDLAALTGIDRDEDYVEAEREEPGCLIAISRQSSVVNRDRLLAAVRAGAWSGRASQLSEDHTTWTFIDEIASATKDPGRAIPPVPLPNHPITRLPDRPLVLRRRSAVAFDGTSAIGVAAFLAMLSRVVPHASAPWDALWWDARIHLAIFVHRVDGLAPGLYLLARNLSALDRLRAACGREFLWERADAGLPLYLLARGDCRARARRLSCDQDIAADGFFSLGMIAEFDASLETYGPSFYRHLFWESGVVGQVLYLEAEAAGARATGSGCFYDDPVHDALGIADHSVQSLYHFTVGMPVEDTRLSTGPGYPWELRTLEPQNPRTLEPGL